jgi:Ala-tRNA(Pro) deacylase
MDVGDDVPSGGLMIPTLVEAHLRLRHLTFRHHTHVPAMTAQDLAAAEHEKGRHVAKPVIVRLNGQLAMAVVPATEKVNLAALEEVTGATAELVPESEFARRFEPCEVGAEPPLALFGVPIFVDEKLGRERTLLMPAGTHEDAVTLETHEWMKCEQAQPVANLGIRAV